MDEAYKKKKFIYVFKYLYKITKTEGVFINL